MTNTNVLITGSIGSGKSSLARMMLDRSPRAIVMDSRLEYSQGAIAHSFIPAARWFGRNREIGRFRMICRFRSKAESTALLELINESREIELEDGQELQPINVFLEEVHRFTGTHSIDPELERLYLFSRHYRLNLVAVVQSDVDVHRAIRQNSQLVVAMRQMKLTTDMERRFPGGHDRLANLTPFNPTKQDRPEYGLNYVTYPEGVDVIALWDRISRGEDSPIDLAISLDTDKESDEDGLSTGSDSGEPSLEPSDSGSPETADAGE